VIEVEFVFDSLIERGEETGASLVKRVAFPGTPTGDADRLTDAGAEAFREDAAERAREAEWN
jgi:hypothetical protein